ncbi:MAG TPA: class I SAM-dependent RNA methyltransferase [Anaerolineaceae bacterium]|nr:class I SAM-dependent RNA methyltransferase [Anaerolineaceae bacterium]
MDINKRQKSVKIEKPIFGGEFLARLSDNKPVFIPFVLPGERAIIKIVQEKKNYARAALLSIQESHPNRVDPPCKYFSICGGCQYQHIDYSEQLNIKKQVLIEQLSRLTGFQEELIKNFYRSDSPLKYRNNIQLSVDPSGKFGFQAFGSHQIIPVSYCLLADEEILQIWQMLDMERIPGLKKVQIRKGIDNEIMVIFESDNFVELPTVELDVPISVIHLSRAGKIVMAGEDHLIHQIKDHYFHVSAESFFQVNDSQTVNMIETVQRYLRNGGGSLLELYCGVGLFTRFLADSFSEIHAVEESPSACDDFAINLDEYDHINLYIGSVKEIVPQLDVKPDAILVDPPRAGLDPGTLETLLSMDAKILVYVSCDISTLARDLRKLIEGGYQLIEMTAIDMFPQTYHLECVVLMSMVDK